MAPELSPEERDELNRLRRENERLGFEKEQSKIELEFARSQSEKQLDFERRHSERCETILRQQVSALKAERDEFKNANQQLQNTIQQLQDDKQRLQGNNHQLHDAQAGQNSLKLTQNLPSPTTPKKRQSQHSLPDRSASKRVKAAEKIIVIDDSSDEDCKPDIAFAAAPRLPSQRAIKQEAVESLNVPQPKAEVSRAARRSPALSLSPEKAPADTTVGRGIKHQLRLAWSFEF